MFLDAALHVIRTKGYEAATVDDLCAAAGLTKGSFLHHFKSEEELAPAEVEYFANEADRVFTNASYQSMADPLARLLGYVDFRRSILQGQLPAFACLLGTMAQETYDSHPSIRIACNRHIGQHAATLTRT